LITRFFPDDISTRMSVFWDSVLDGCADLRVEGRKFIVGFFIVDDDNLLCWGATFEKANTAL